MKLASLFSDHAVLQREMPVAVWGWTKPAVMVSVSCGPYKAKALAGPDGKFLTYLPAMKAGGPYVLEASAGSEKALAKDVWVGEVWLASGQSNMQMCVDSCGETMAAELTKVADAFRMFTVSPCCVAAGKRHDVAADWEIATLDTIGQFSAAAACFAKVIAEETGLKVGIVNSSIGGTIIEAWTSRETLVREPSQRALVESYEAKIFSPESENRKPVSSLPADPGNEGLAKRWAASDFDDSAWETMCLPSAWTKKGHKFSGIFWFRKTVDVPKAWAGKDLKLSIGAVDKHDITYFNGEEVGRTGSGFNTDVWNMPRNYVVPGSLVKAGRNVIAVRAYSFLFDGGLIGPASRMRLALNEETVAIDGDWNYAIECNFGIVTPPPSLGEYNHPHLLFDNMIAPLIPYGIRGAIWYQGESNASSDKGLGGVHAYHRMLVDMIRDWRFAWGQGDFPFYIVQIANYTATSNWPVIREAQLKALSEPETGLVVAIDIGEELDIHPKDKTSVGERLARWALAKVHGKHIEVSGPLYRSQMVDGASLLLKFDHVGGGLVAKGGPLKTFQIAEADGCFVPATAVIEGDAVRVSSPQCLVPVAVRYAWSNYPDGCNLYNKAGLPASPFRTDSWSC